MSLVTGIEFDRTSSGAQIRDTISSSQYEIQLSGAVDWSRQSTNGDAFPAPVSETLSVDTERVSFLDSYALFVRNDAGELLEHVGSGQTASFDCGEYFLELSPPVKTYLRVTGPFECTNTGSSLRIELFDNSNVVIGVRPWRCYPTSEITIADNPLHLMKAVSCFGSAIETTSPERSFPTLRGHPPAIRLGTDLHIPEQISPPSTGITLTVPAELSSIYAVAPLAYYLLASVVPDDQFSIRIGDFQYEPQGTDIAESVARILHTCFILDCLVRTEGLYPVDLHERERLESHTHVNLDYSNLYHLSHEERVKEYLQISHEDIREISPHWPVTAIIQPGFENAEALPALVTELSKIRPDDPPQYSGTEAQVRLVKSFAEGSGSTRTARQTGEIGSEFVDVPSTDSQQTVWVGDGIPINASAFMTSGVQHKIDRLRDTRSSELLEVTVVCNEAAMDDESDDVDQTYSPREDLPARFTVHRRVTTEKLQELIENGTDYLHFIGHATPDGLRCVDGHLDVRTVSQSAVDLFCLNACQSYQQGVSLVELGSIGGIVTYNDVPDRFAGRIGNLTVGLLGAGFSIGTIHEILTETTVIGGQYTVVGDHTANLAQPGGGAPYMARITSMGDGYQLEISSYTAGGSPGYSIGTLSSYALSQFDQHCVVPSTIGPMRIEQESLAEFLSYSNAPIIVDGELTWEP